MAPSEYHSRVSPGLPGDEAGVERTLIKQCRAMYSLLGGWRVCVSGIGDEWE